MKKLLLIAVLLFGLNTFAQSYTDRGYAYLEPKNAYGENFVDFNLTYDNATGSDNCYNNIQIYAQDVDINIYFQIYIDNVKVYDGWAKLPAGTNYYLNDAFYHCSSSYKDIEIQVQGRG